MKATSCRVEGVVPTALELDERLLIGFDSLCAGCADAGCGDEDETERFAPLHVEPFRVQYVRLGS